MEMTWKEVVVAYFEALSRQLTVVTVENKPRPKKRTGTQDRI
jgi:hypothetical protein